MSNVRILKGRDLKLFGMPSLEKKLKEPEKFMPTRPSVEEIERDAYEKGFAAGERAGLEMGAQKSELLIAKIERVIGELGQYREGILKEIEPQLLDLAADIARKVIHEELSVRPEVMVTVVREAMRRLERTGPITIKINPAVHELFRKHQPQLLEVHSEIIFDVDPALMPTGQVVIGASEEIVTDIDDQLGNIMDDLGGSSAGH